MAVMLAGFFAFNSSQSDQSAAPSFAPIGAPTGTASPTVGPTVSPSSSSSQSAPPSTPTTVPIFTGRDPFAIPAVLVTVAPPSSGATTPPTSGTGTTTITPTYTGSTTPTTPPPTQPGGGSSTVIDGHTVVLLDVFPSGSTHKAQVEVDGHVYNPSVGDKFDAGQFELRSVSGNCATFLYGDQSFGLCATSPK
jgi:hypothetical protein